MPLYLEKRINGSRLAVWQMTETEEEFFSMVALSEELKSEVKGFLSETRIETLHVIWGAKEVLFKIHGKGGLDFKKQMHVHPFVPAVWGGSVDAELKTDGKISHFKIHYFFSGKLIVVYASS